MRGGAAARAARAGAQAAPVAADSSVDCSGRRSLSRVGIQLVRIMACMRAAGLRVRAVCGLPGEQAGHSPSTYCSHSSRCTASSGNANSELLQALRACSHASRHTPSGAPKAQPSMYDAHMKLFSASMHERPRNHAGMGSICLPTSAS